MSPSLSELLKLPAGERAELAMALWDSLSEAEREGELELTPEEGEELDRRWSDHVQRPDSSIPWAEVRRKLLDLALDARLGLVLDDDPRVAAQEHIAM